MPLIKKQRMFTSQLSSSKISSGLGSLFGASQPSSKENPSSKDIKKSTDIPQDNLTKLWSTTSTLVQSPFKWIQTNLNDNFPKPNYIYDSSKSTELSEDVDWPWSFLTHSKDDRENARTHLKDAILNLSHVHISLSPILKTLILIEICLLK